MRRGVGGVHLKPSRLEAGELVSGGGGGDVGGRNRHRGGPVGAGAADAKAFLEGFPGHFGVRRLTENFFVSGGVLSDDVIQSAVGLAGRRRPLLAAQYGADGESGEVNSVVFFSGS